MIQLAGGGHGCWAEGNNSCPASLALHLGKIPFNFCSLLVIEMKNLNLNFKIVHVVFSALPLKMFAYPSPFWDSHRYSRDFISV